MITASDAGTLVTGSTATSGDARAATSTVASVAERHET